MRPAWLARSLQTTKSLSPHRVLFPSLAVKHARIVPQAISRRPVSTKQLYEGHVPLNWFEQTFLTVGSGLKALTDPRRGDMVAAFGELTAGPCLPRLRDRLLEDSEGRRIMKDRPRVNTETVNMEQLAQYPEGTFGRAYVTWLERCGVTPDTREPVHYIDDPELAYVMQRYRECHDFYHCICNLPVNVESEVALKIFEFANLGIPMAGFAALFAPLRLTATQRERLYSKSVPWALKCGGNARSLITIYWEERWGQSVEEIQKEFGIWDAPEARWSKPLSEAKAAAASRQRKASIRKTGECESRLN